MLCANAREECHCQNYFVDTVLFQGILMARASEVKCFITYFDVLLVFLKHLLLNSFSVFFFLIPVLLDLIALFNSVNINSNLMPVTKEVKHL